MHATSLGAYRFPASYLEIVLAAWKSCGLDDTALLREANLQQRYPLPADAMVTGQELVRLYSAGRLLYQAPFPFSLKLAQQFNFTNVGLLGLAVVSAENLPQVLDIVRRYLHLFAPGTLLEHRILAEGFEIRCEFSEAYGSARPFLNELIAGIIRRFSLYFSKNPQPIRVDFTHSPGFGTEHYREYFGCDVRFQAPENILVFSLSDMTAAPPLAEPETLSQLQAKLDRILSEQQGTLSWSDRVGQICSAALDEGRTPALEDIAGLLSMAPRTLERRLQQEGTRYSRIIQDLRLKRARTLLADPALSVSEIAYRIGFQDSNAFSRFFKQATGQSPAAFRSQLLGG